METLDSGTKLKDRISNGEATDHDILIELYNDVKWIKKIIGDHFRQHWAITMAVVGATTLGYYDGCGWSYNGGNSCFVY
jgi:hypothetical protein